MNEVSQTLGLRSPSITLYAFHLRNSINQGLEPTVAEAPLLWEQLVDLGNKLHITELQTLQQQLICYENNKYFPQAEDSLGIEYSTLLRNQEQSLNFRLIPQTDGLELQGLLCPFRLHDTYAIDFTLSSKDTFTLPQLSNLNPDNLLLTPQIQASLGQTILLFGQPIETQENYQYLANACIAEILSGRNSTELVGTGYLLGNPIFEYESAHTNPAQKLHILVWFKCQNMNSQHMDKVAENLLYLLWCRHKIQYVYYESRWCDAKAKQLYGKWEDYRQRFNQVSQTANQQSRLRQLLGELRQIELEYARYLGEIVDHENTIVINEQNYRNKLEKLELLPETNLGLWQQFLRYIRNKLQLQIQTDLRFLERGRDRFQHLKATVQESIATAPVESQSRFGDNSWEQPVVTNYPNNLRYHEDVAVKKDMPGIPEQLYSRLYEALLDCDQFDSVQRLRNFFKANDSLTPWRNRWQDGSPSALVEDALGYLNDKINANTNENALFILVRLLANQYDLKDSRRQTLSELAQELNATFLGYNRDSNIIPFSKNTDTTTSKELLKTSLALEANSKGEPMPYIAVDEKLLSCSRAVARVSVPKIVNGSMRKIPTGTGWLVTPELALTCQHVIEARSFRDTPICRSDLDEQIANSVFTFDYTQGGEGLEYGVMQPEYENRDLDYALLRLRDRQDFPLQKREFLKLDADIPLTLQTQLYVIQHPRGQPQQRSAGFFKSASDFNILHSAPTEEGTSGAPVLNVTNWRVVALHKGENDIEKLRKATLIRAILTDLKQNSSELYKEIMTVQDPH